MSFISVAPKRDFERFVPDLDDAEIRRLSRHCLRYRDADDRAAWFQFGTTFALFLLTAGLLLFGATTGVYVLLALALPAGGLLVRLFGVQHDCGHNSFFTSKRTNRAVGRLLSVLTLTPFGYWSRSHAVHHTTAGDLGRRGIGDVDTLTVDEYDGLSRSAQMRYRIYRHPLLLHVVGPPVYFILLQRSPFGQALPVRDAWRSIMALNLALALLYGSLVLVLGPIAVALAVLPTAFVASWIGGWLFFVQHQFEDTHWEESTEWSQQRAALSGSSYYVMPKLLQWFTGNIGLHHIHHLNPRIPNYRLQACLDAEPALASLSRLTILESLQCVGLALWDPTKRKLVAF
ncbi:fatty acid desaturase [Aureimonas ureilytica]|uniref:fatty acid desaturase n=1 Tax=Aureimonas ureilytica TaxID=401562 RepID=UPI00036B87E6|nr:fatty acid desaturase [Aureimonas ureilytica]